MTTKPLLVPTKKMPRKPRKGEYTCRCGAYRFPHRFGGGRCTGIVIAVQTWESNWGRGICSRCNCLNKTDGISCEVIEGIEDVSCCNGFIEFVTDNEIELYD